MQKAKVGDLIYAPHSDATKPGRYLVVIGVANPSVCGSDIGNRASGYAAWLNPEEYQIVFSPHAHDDQNLSSRRMLLQLLYALVVKGVFSFDETVTMQKAILDGGEEGFAAKVNELFPSDALEEKASQDPERARVGDVIGNYNTTHTVVGVNESDALISTFSEGMKRIPHGSYTIFERASDLPKDKPMQMSEYKQEPSTPELVAMLAKREGFTRMDLPYASDKLYWTRQSDNGMLLPWVTQGPCTILVIPETGE